MHLTIKLIQQTLNFIFLSLNNSHYNVRGCIDYKIDIHAGKL